MVKTYKDFPLSERQTLNPSFFLLAVCLDLFNTGKSLRASHEYVAKSKFFITDGTHFSYQFFLSFLDFDDLF